MLRFLTNKLRTHSLYEVHPFVQAEEFERDSGTESDDEQGRPEDLEDDMASDDIKVDSRFGSADGGECALLSASSSSNLSAMGKCDSPTALDSALPSDSDPNLDQHSSEEELEVINSCVREGPEKRKWGQANRRSFGDSSGSSDEEVRDLMCSSLPLEFRASPPADAHKPAQSQSPPAKLFHFSPATLTPFEVCAVSPRKRHRQNHNAAPTMQNRPCLDFEKMQQLRTRAVTTWRTSREVSLIC